MSKGKFHEFEEIPCSFRLKKVIQTMEIATFVCVLTQKNFLTYISFSLFINYGSFGRKVSKGNSLSCLVLLQERFSENGKFTFSTFS